MKSEEFAAAVPDAGSEEGGYEADGGLKSEKEEKTLHGDKAKATPHGDSSLFPLPSSLKYYEAGNRFRREGNWQEAINNYIAAIELDPDSPAVEAKQMLDDILSYYNKDMYNP